VLKVNLKFTHHKFQLIHLWQTDRHIIAALVVALVVVYKEIKTVELNFPV
jgi:hypothetical protein